MIIQDKTQTYVDAASLLIQGDLEVIKFLLWEAIYAETISFDNDGNPFLDATGEPLIANLNT